MCAIFSRPREAALKEEEIVYMPLSAQFDDRHEGRHHRETATIQRVM